LLVQRESDEKHVGCKHAKIAVLGYLQNGISQRQINIFKNGFHIWNQRKILYKAPLST
jgi:hypothetical protein